jgi:hypothetical protein
MLAKQLIGAGHSMNLPNLRNIYIHTISFISPVVELFRPVHLFLITPRIVKSMIASISTFPDVMQLCLDSGLSVYPAVSCMRQLYLQGVW